MPVRETLEVYVHNVTVDLDEEQSAGFELLRDHVKTSIEDEKTHAESITNQLNVANGRSPVTNGDRHFIDRSSSEISDRMEHAMSGVLAVSSEVKVSVYLDEKEPEIMLTSDFHQVSTREDVSEWEDTEGAKLREEKMEAATDIKDWLGSLVRRHSEQLAKVDEAKENLELAEYALNAQFTTRQ